MREPDTAFNQSIDQLINQHTLFVMQVAWELVASYQRVGTVKIHL